MSISHNRRNKKFTKLRIETKLCFILNLEIKTTYKNWNQYLYGLDKKIPIILIEFDEMLKKSLSVKVTNKIRWNENMISFYTLFIHTHKTFLIIFTPLKKS